MICFTPIQWDRISAMEQFVGVGQLNVLSREALFGDLRVDPVTVYFFLSFFFSFNPVYIDFP
jgi:hypothetical protein